MPRGILGLDPTTKAKAYRTTHRAGHRQRRAVHSHT